MTVDQFAEFTSNFAACKETTHLNQKPLLTIALKCLNNGHSISVNSIGESVKGVGDKARFPRRL